MRSGSAPLRFLGLVGVSWIAYRAVALAPWWTTTGAAAPPLPPAVAIRSFFPAAEAPPGPALHLSEAQGRSGSAVPSPFHASHRISDRRAGWLGRAAAQSSRAPNWPVAYSAPPQAAERQVPPAPSFQQAPLPFAPAPLLIAADRNSRWSGAAWLFIRDGSAGARLAPGGALGGSQAGARLTYRLNEDGRRPLAASLRVSAPLDRLQGAEAAVGLDWRPLASVPVNILAERREAIGREGRSDFALLAYGGTDRAVAGGRLRLEAYAQAGVVGLEERDPFADGSAVVTARIGPVDIGGGVWGGAQPGAARLDAGPHASMRLPVGDATIRIAAEWRFRVAGDAAPASGPALTIATGF